MNLTHLAISIILVSVISIGIILAIVYYKTNKRNMTIDDKIEGPMLSHQENESANLTSSNGQLQSFKILS